MVVTADWVLAVDLGTTKTRAAYTSPGSREPVEVRIPPDNATWLPSCVARDPDSGGWLVGKDAERLRTGWTGAFVQNAKRLLGQAEPHYFDGHPFSILEIVAQPLIQVAMVARAQAGHVFDRLALAAPVQFEEYRRELLLQAAESAGFPASCVSIATEAEAAARTALGSSPADGDWLLFDMGGGTLDVALLRTRAGELRVLDAFGTDEVSGYVLDTAVMEHLRTAYASELAPAAGGKSGKDGTDQDAGQWREALLRDTAELAKTGVTARGPGRATLADPQLRVVLTPDALRKAAAPAIGLGLEKCEQLLSQNGLQWQQLKAVICAGGSTRGPVIRELLSAPGAPVRDAAGTPELAVVHGLLASGARSRPFHPKTIRPANSTGVHALRALAHTSAVGALAFSPSGAYLAAASGASVEIWNPADGTHLWTFAEHTAGVRALAFGPGDLLASSSDDQTVRLRRLGRDDTSRVLRAEGTVGAVAFSPDGSLLAHGGGDNLVRLVAVDSGDQVLEPLSGHEAVISHVGFAPDGNALATAAGRVVRVWDPADGTVRAVLNGHTSDVAALAFSPDSTRLATASHDHTVRIWDPDHGTCRQVFNQHTNYVRCVAFSPTGEFVASGGDDSVVRLWDPDEGRQLFALGVHQGYLWSVAFSPDGTLLAGGDNAQVRIWGLG